MVVQSFTTQCLRDLISIAFCLYTFIPLPHCHSSRLVSALHYELLTLFLWTIIFIFLLICLFQTLWAVAKVDNFDAYLKEQLDTAGSELTTLEQNAAPAQWTCRFSRYTRIPRIHTYLTPLKV